MLLQIRMLLYQSQIHSRILLLCSLAHLTIRKMRIRRKDKEQDREDAP